MSTIMLALIFDRAVARGRGSVTGETAGCEKNIKSPGVNYSSFFNVFTRARLYKKCVSLLFRMKVPRFRRNNLPFTSDG